MEREIELEHINQLITAVCELMAEQGIAAVIKKSKHFILVAINLSNKVIIVIIIFITVAL